MSDLKEWLRGMIVYLLTLEAQAVVKKYKPKIIMITGSVGKTSSKDAAYTALADSFFVRKSEKSFNSDVGVPLTILGVPNGWSDPFRWFRNLLDGLSLVILSAPYPRWLVLEVGADRPGDITKSLAWLKPDVVVATRFPDVPVHVEFYKEPEDVVKEESAPASWLVSDGALVTNADDFRALELAPGSGARKITYGFSQSADVRATRYVVTSKNKMPTGISFDVAYGVERAHVSIPGVVGKTHVTSVLAGIGAALAVGVPLERAAEAFAKHVAPPGRTRLIDGAHETMIIDDTYNSSPVAVEEALGILANVPRKGRRIAVLGDMLELGSYSVAEHTRIGAVAALSCDLLITAGIRAKDIAIGATAAGMAEDAVIRCDRGEDVIAVLSERVAPGDVILIKGSQSMRMERVVKALMKNPEEAKNLLVRQDAEWGLRK